MAAAPPGPKTLRKEDWTQMDLSDLERHQSELRKAMGAVLKDGCGTRDSNSRCHPWVFCMSWCNLTFECPGGVKKGRGRSTRRRSTTRRSGCGGAAGHDEALVHQGTTRHLFIRA